MHDIEFEMVESDELSAARGILLGMAIGACMWIVVAVAIWLW